MLDNLDWLRRSRTGAELIATLKCLAAEPDLASAEAKIGPPLSAFGGPCQRCWIYPRASGAAYCEFCQAILDEAWKLGDFSRRSVVIWGFVNRLPKQLQNGEGFRDSRISGAYVHDEQRFLLMMHKRQLRPCLQEMVIYHGSDLRGLIQIFPTAGSRGDVGMGDFLCRAIHHEASFPMDQLRVRFYSAPYQLIKPHRRDRQGLLTFEVSEFLRLLEMAAVFRTLLRPEEQNMLSDLLKVDDVAEEQFYWGRFMGYLGQEAKDMLKAWKIRQWPRNRIKLLYELIDYVAFSQTY